MYNMYIYFPAPSGDANIKKKKNNNHPDENIGAKYLYIYIHTYQFSSVAQFVSDSLQPHESQLARPPCPSPTPGVHPDSCHKDVLLRETHLPARGYSKGT